ncbi:MAG TPA: hypothetical protein VE621_10940 [Bryobacteraceae bacterium]|jgi:hypothetical protein|nr:hypothetical protein [Bryobacteraceae bacterium]
MRLALVCLFCVTTLHSAAAFKVTLSPLAHKGAVDGRLIVAIATNDKREPRYQVSWNLQTAQIFGVDVTAFTPDRPVLVDGAAIGHPIRSLAGLPPGKYYVQAVLNIYETVQRADGKVLKLPLDDGEGQQWNRSPGNLFSKPRLVEIAGDSVTDIELTEVIPPIEPEKDSKYLRQFRMQSDLLTRFWGRPVYISATVLVPEGFDEHPERRYPIAYRQGHFVAGFPWFRETPGPAGDRFAESAHRLYQDWTSGRLPKMLIVSTQHATPYYDDSYGVNSANTGPYGDALMKEFYPALEKQFRAIGEPWARVVYGGSTGGWMTLAQQIFYPEFFGGAWGFCPDPVDFHAFQTINVYSDSSAYYDIGPFARQPKLLGRQPDDRVLATMESFSQQEAVLGSKGRSGGQLDAFHATFGPVGPEGYPAKLWDSETGVIDPQVARYWTEQYDLTAILKRDWERLGPKLVGKLHVTMGTKDTFFLDAAAKRMEEFLESTRLPRKGPYYGGTFDYGNNEPHCWTGSIPAGQSRESFYLPVFAEHMRKMAPQGADLQSWK